MNQTEFDTALSDTRTQIAKMFGDDAAHSAIISALKKGAGGFESAERLRNYVSASARGDVHITYPREKRRQELMRDYGLIMRGIKQHLDRDVDARIDVERATRSLDYELQEAVRAYLLEDVSIEEATEFMLSSRNPKRRLLAVVDRLFKTRLQAYAR